jgi:glycosyltransferase involved in cell wall biosynthesis
MSINEDIRVAWLFPSLAGGNYWHPVLAKFSQFFRQTRVYTGEWLGFSPGFEDAFQVQVIGKIRQITSTTVEKSEEGYGRGFIKLSPYIIQDIYKFKPHIIFASGFSMWTIIAVIFKPWGKWKIVIVYDGSSPNVDYQDSPIRSWLRSKLVKLADACITNSNGGKNYLTKVIHAREDQVYCQPYQVPEAQTLLKLVKDNQPINETKPGNIVFLFIGKLILRKGLEFLLKACKILQSWGYFNYTLMVLGEGTLRDELVAYSEQHNLNVQWIGWVDYGLIGSYFQNADVFVLPTLEDTWGMVVLESMVFGKPVLCSHLAGASEMIVDDVNGYLFNPKEPEELAKLMRKFIDNPDLISSMGEASQQLIAQHTPEAAAQFLIEVTKGTLQQFSFQ